MKLPRTFSAIILIACCFLQNIYAEGNRYNTNGTPEFLQVNQQTRSISGIVMDSDNQPAIGANILEKGTNNGITTDVDGKFSLNVSAGAVLVISYIGYLTQEVTIGNQTQLNIRLLEDRLQLDEVVVVGYGSIAKKELTSTVSQVSSKDFLQIGNNPIQAIQGKMAGVSISNTGTGDPNNGTNIQIRGVSSRSAGLGPLIVINGVPGGNLENLNDADIESITVLKDGAASAIYGTRGSNGVVIVTTKKGATDGIIRTSYRGYVSFAKPINELKIMSAEDYVSRGFTDRGHRTDWFKEVSQTGFTHNHSLQLSGGNSQTNYLTSVDYKDAEGMDIRADRKEIGARIGINHTTTNGLFNFTLNLAPRQIKVNNANWNSFNLALIADPTLPVMNPDKPGIFTDVTGVEASNPVEPLAINKSGEERKFLDWDATVKLNLWPLFAKNQDERHTLSTQVTIAQQVKDYDKFSYTPSTNTQAMKEGTKGNASKNYDHRKQESLEWLGNYTFDHAGHSLRFMGGFSHQYFLSSGLSGSNRDFASDALEYNNLGSGAYDKVEGRAGMGSYKNDNKLIAFFGRLTYNYKDRYLFTASIRREGSSKFGANHKWGSFPAVSAGWIISNEGFMQDISWLNELKVRGDYGVTGNQDFGNYRSLVTMASYGSVLYDGKLYTGWSPGKNVNEDLRWEKGKNWNIGIDFAVLKTRLSGSLNYYNRKQVDLLGDYNVPVPPNLHTSTFANVGTMKNTGIEVELNIDCVRTKDFTYSVSLVGSTSNNKFVSFSNNIYQGQNFYWQDGFPAPGSPGPVQRIEEGERIGNFVTFEYAGVDENGAWLVYNKDGEKISIYEGTDDDKKVVGNGLPKFSLSWSNNLRYRDFDLNLYFRGNFGYQVYNSHEFYYGLQALTGQNLLESAFTKNAHIKGDNIHNSYFVQDADYLKLDVVTLGYTKKIQSNWIQNIRVYATARNVFTITKLDGVNPEAYSVAGLQPGIIANKKGYYPSSRQYLFGVQVNF